MSHGCQPVNLSPSVEGILAADARRLTAGRAYPAAEDLLQEVRAELWAEQVNPGREASRDGLTLVAGRRAMVDALRRILGRPGSARARGQHPDRTDYPDGDGPEAVARWHWDRLLPASPDPCDVVAHRAAAEAVMRRAGRLHPALPTLLAILADGGTLAEAGRAVGLTESRACQLRARARDRLARLV